LAGSGRKHGRVTEQCNGKSSCCFHGVFPGRASGPVHSTTLCLSGERTCWCKRL
jgi:hypothetical protein